MAKHSSVKYSMIKPNLIKQALAAVVSRHDSQWLGKPAALWDTLGLTLFGVIVGLVLQLTLGSLPTEALIWLGLSALIVAIYHGTGHGLVGLMSLYAMMILLSILIKGERVFLTPNMIMTGAGVMLWVFLVGEASHWWRRKADGLAQQSERFEARLTRFSRDYQLLKVSHDQLALQGGQVVPNLRGAIRTLKHKAEIQPGNRPEYLAQEMLELIALYGSVQCAGLYQLEHAQDMASPAFIQRAVVGTEHRLLAEDAMLRAALETGQLQHVTATNEHPYSRYQVCIPCVDSFGDTVGVIAVESIHLFALNQSNLKLLLLLAHHYADLLSDRLLSRVYKQNERNAFVARINRSIEQAHHCRSDALLLTVVGTKREKVNVLLDIARGFRDMDVKWLHKSRISLRKQQSDTTEHKDVPALTVLLPLTELSQGQMAAKRVQRQIEKQLGRPFSELGVVLSPPKLAQAHPIMRQPKRNARPRTGVRTMIAS